MKTYLQFGKAGEPMRSVSVSNRQYMNHAKPRIQYGTRWYAVQSGPKTGFYVMINGERVRVLITEH